MEKIRANPQPRIIICGKSGSGKDHLRKKLVDRGYVYQVPFTTRPKRVGEAHGIDYNFIDLEGFESLKEANQIYEYSEFKGWYYGTLKSQWSDARPSIFVMSPIAISKINKAKDRKNSLIIYLDIEESIRRERILGRIDDNDSVERRLNSDFKDFLDFKDYDIRITNEDF